MFGIRTDFFQSLHHLVFQRIFQTLCIFCCFFWRYAELHSWHFFQSIKLLLVVPLWWNWLLAYQFKADGNLGNINICYYLYSSSSTILIKSKFLNCVSFLIISTYFFSGLHKLNGGFLYTVWEKMILIKFLDFNPIEIQNIFVHYSGLTLPIFEILAALGLLFAKK